MDTIVAEKWTVKHTAQIDSLAEALEIKQKPHAKELLSKIALRAGESEVYRNRVITWLNGEAGFGEVSDLCKPLAILNDQGTRNNVFLLHRTLLNMK